MPQRELIGYGIVDRVDERLGLAVEENVVWCNRVARAHGVDTRLDVDRWWASSRTPPLYPDVVTRSPDLVDVEAVLAGVDAGPGCSVKDSFACLDLGPAGFEVLFEARWVHRPAVEYLGQELNWRVDQDVDPVLAPVADDRAVALFAGRVVWGPIVARMVLHDAHDVVGISNVTGDGPAAWEDAGRLAGPRPLVGYERGDALAVALTAGAVDVGPLRVWVRPD